MLLMIFVSGTLLEAMKSHGPSGAHCAHRWMQVPLVLWTSPVLLFARISTREQGSSAPMIWKGQNMKRYAKAVLLLLAVAGTTPLGRFCDVVKTMLL